MIYLLVIFSALYNDYKFFFQTDFKVNACGVAEWSGCSMMTKSGNVTAPTMVNAPIKWKFTILIFIYVNDSAL